MLKRIYYRSYHYFLKILLKLTKIPIPEIIEGEGCYRKLVDLIKNSGISKILIVTGKNLKKHGLIDELLKEMGEKGVEYAIYDGAKSNPTIPDVEEGLEKYQTESCQGVVALGGGSKIDCAKFIAARVGNPNTSVMELIGILKIKNDF